MDANLAITLIVSCLSLVCIILSNILAIIIRNILCFLNVFKMVVSNCGNPEAENGLTSSSINDTSESPEFILSTSKTFVIGAAERPAERPFKPFVLWWSTMTSSVLQLLRRQHHSFSYSTRSKMMSTTESPTLHEDQNNLAAGLDSIFQVDLDVPSNIDVVPSE